MPTKKVTVLSLSYYEINVQVQQRVLRENLFIILCKKNFRIKTATRQTVIRCVQNSLL